MLIPHVEVEISPEIESVAYKVIQPEVIPFISYPYEWCFSQLKHAALLTLNLQKLAIRYDMSLKDASAYNVQFNHGKPMLIDTLSFEKYREGHPWVAYRQFCQHFYAPLALMALTDIRLNQLARIYIDGIPLDLASKLLPLSSWFSFSTLSHIHLHAKSQQRFADKNINMRYYKISRTKLLGIINSIESGIQKLNWQPGGTEWGDYYEKTNYTPRALKQKKESISEYIDEIKPKSVWDIGANTGLFSRLASEKGIQTISFDIDPAAVEKNYQGVVRHNEQYIIPLCLDLTNPSPSIGWENNERMSLQERGPADVILALALIHHLAISNNLPFQKIAQCFSKLCQYLIIEFVPKSDSQVQRLLITREDIFSSYTQPYFEKEFSDYFYIEKINPMEGSERVLYLMKKRRDIEN